MFIDTFGLRFHVEVVGEGFPLVLLHGFTGDASTWTDIVEKLQSSSKVIMIDLIGHGKTSTPEDLRRYEMEQVIEDLRNILAQLGVEQADFVGYSMGGRTALALAVTYPNLVRKLVLESASPGLKSQAERIARQQKDDELAQLIEDRGLDWFVSYWGDIPLFASQKNLPLLKQERIKEQRKQNSIKGLSASLRGMGTGKQLSYWDQLENYQGDVLLVTGEYDQKFVDIAKQMQEKLKSCQHVTFPYVGHAIHVEEPEKFGTIVNEFLSNDENEFGNREDLL